MRKTAKLMPRTILLVHLLSSLGEEKKTWQDTQTEDEKQETVVVAARRLLSRANFESKPSSPPKKKHSEFAL
uniref:Secreted protein n=1 Tax=Ditylenchus dipsaci TaxID=166011 RepID=A0A915E915_9BILA